jgi:hypothetical protein
MVIRHRQDAQHVIGNVVVVDSLGSSLGLLHSISSIFDLLQVARLSIRVI